MPARSRRRARPLLTVLAVTACWAAGTGPALAHVDVLPTAAVQGEAQRFTIRVPSERPVPTVAVRVHFPRSVTVYAFKQAPGWTRRILLAPDRRPRGVVYRGGRVGEGEFAEFDLLATPNEPGVALWRAEQTYADGVVKSWSGPPERPGEPAVESAADGPGPSSATTISAPGATSEGAASADAAGGDGGSSGAGTWLGIIAIAIAAAAAAGVGLLWSNRPARLPGDDR